VLLNKLQEVRLNLYGAFKKLGEHPESNTNPMVSTSFSKPHVPTEGMARNLRTVADIQPTHPTEGHPGAPTAAKTYGDFHKAVPNNPRSLW